MSEYGPGAGRTRQDVIYRDGILGRRPRVPTDLARLEAAARRRMSRRAWAYLGFAGAGQTGQANRESFQRWQIVPRMASGVEQRDLTSTVAGTHLSCPVMLAPVGAADMARRNADVQIASGAAHAGAAYIFSNQGGSPMEDTAAVMGATPHWFQLYWSRDEQLVDSFIARAEANGAGALVVTLDTTMLGWRPADLDLGSLPFAHGYGIAQYTSDPRFAELVRENLATAPVSDVKVTLGAVRTLIEMSRRHPGRFMSNVRSSIPRAAIETFLDVYSNPALSWQHLAGLRERTRLPIILKGILHPDDALKARDLGVDAIMVSNHGGRQVDGSIASLDALTHIRRALGPEFPLVLDSGIRGGADIFKAIALGACAVTVGRPHIYGLAVRGAAGVADVITNMVAEFELVMGLSGARSISEISTEYLVSR